MSSNTSKINGVKINDVSNTSKINNNKKEKRNQTKKEWKQFKSTYTFLILALLIYSLRPLHINRNNEELSYMTEIISYDLNIDNYKDKLNDIIIYITTKFIINNSREEIIKKSKTKSKILDIIKLLLNIKSYKDFYSKLIEYEPLLTNNKDFFNFISSLISFSHKNFNHEKSVDTIIYLIKRNPNSLLNESLSKVTNKINKKKNNNINDKIKKYKDLLIKVSELFFKNLAKNNSVNFVNSRVILKKNINTIPINTPKIKNNGTEFKEAEETQINQSNQSKEGQSQINQSNIFGGNKNKSKSKNISIKNMWWLKKYR